MSAEICQKLFGKFYLFDFDWRMEQNECGGQSWAQQIILIVEYSLEDFDAHITLSIHAECSPE